VWTAKKLLHYRHERATIVSEERSMRFHKKEDLRGASSEVFALLPPFLFKPFADKVGQNICNDRKY
jgi:hypothetical protein